MKLAAHRVKEGSAARVQKVERAPSLAHDDDFSCGQVGLEQRIGGDDGFDPFAQEFYLDL